VAAGLGVRPLPPSYRCARRIYTCSEEKGREEIDRWMALSTDATWLRLPLLMLLGPAAAPSLSSRIVLSLSHVFVGTTGRKGRGRSAWGNVTSHFISFPFYSLSLSLDFLSPPLLCASRLSVLARWNWKRGSGLRNRKLGKRSPASSASTYIKFKSSIFISKDSKVQQHA
jgi:hypothetical protein